MKEQEVHNAIVKKPFPGFQTYFASTNVDICFGAGGVGNGKSYSLALGFAEPLMLDPDFRCLISRRSLGNQKAGGGFVDTFKDIFGEYVKVKEADTPRISFQSGAYCDLTYIDPTNIDRMRERAKDGSTMRLPLMSLPKCLGRYLRTFNPVIVEKAKHSRGNSVRHSILNAPIGREDS